jgi:hypothetical protein
MIHDIVSASYKGGYKIEIVFDDGKGGVFASGTLPSSKIST